MKDYLGIDLGTGNTTVYYSYTNSTIFSEPTAIAYDLTSHTVSEIGFLASKIQGKTPFRYEVVHPVLEGEVSDDDAAYDYLSRIIDSIHMDRRFRSTGLIFAIPSICSKVNRKVLISIGKKLYAKEIYLESQAKLAALGSGEASDAPSAMLICQIGAGIADIALLSMGEVVSAATTHVAGITFDEAIRRYLIQKQHLSIGMKSAEYLKMRSGSVMAVNESLLTEIKGRDTITSLPSSVVVSSSELRSVLLPLADAIAAKITDVIATASPELVADLPRNGLILSGGGALLGGFADYLRAKLSMPVRLAEKPFESVSLGFARYIAKLQEKEGK